MIGQYTISTVFYICLY